MSNGCCAKINEKGPTFMIDPSFTLHRLFYSNLGARCCHDNNHIYARRRRAVKPADIRPPARSASTEGAGTSNVALPSWFVDENKLPSFRVSKSPRFTLVSKLALNLIMPSSPSQFDHISKKPVRPSQPPVGVLIKLARSFPSMPVKSTLPARTVLTPVAAPPSSAIFIKFV